MPLKANAKKRRHIMVVSEEVHQTLFQIAEVGEITPGEVLEALFSGSLTNSRYILGVLKGNYKNNCKKE